jgi:HEAT repeat protein
VDELREMLAADDAATRSAAAHGLGLLNEQSAPAVGDLAHALDDADLRVRIEAAVALGKIGPAAAPAVEQLCGLLADSDAALRKQAATALGRIGDARALPSLRAALDDEIPFVRSAAADAVQAIEGRDEG